MSRRTVHSGRRARRRIRAEAPVQAPSTRNIPAKGVRQVVFPYPRSFFEEWFDSDDDAESSVKIQQQRAAFQALPEDMRRALRYAAMLDRMQRGEMMAIMPFELTVK